MRTSHRRTLILALLAGGGLLTGFLLRYGEQWLRLALLYLSTAVWSRRFVSNLSLAWRVAGRFVAGEDIGAALTVARELNARGMSVTLDYLGESVTNRQEAITARDEILQVLDCIAETAVDANVSVKLSQLGLKIEEGLALDNMRCLLQRAQQYNNKIRIDMEESGMVDITLKIYRQLRDQYGFQNVGVVIQSYLYRSRQDVADLVAEGAWIRLCKGAYAEPPQVAFPVKADTDQNFVALMQMMLNKRARQKGVYLGVATHDEKMITATIDHATADHLSKNEFEFQLLYGIRRELQESLVAQGYRVRIYIPYGTAWYPYFMRRLAERPANLWFFISNFLRN